jgi:hypothetical protein
MDQPLVPLFNKFNKRLVYRLGSDAGFFSEYNNMILAMLYCLKHEICFQLYSQNANFATRGITDFFEPFCNEDTNAEHELYNPRYDYPFLQNLFHTVQRKRERFKRLNRIDYLTADLWNDFRDQAFAQEIFNIPELGIHGDTRRAGGQLIELIWKYNTQTQSMIKQKIAAVPLPAEYVGLHIRRGDKSKETRPIESEKYFSLIDQEFSKHNVFVSTDDYQVIIELKKSFPGWNIFTLCGAEEKGYFHREFIKLAPERKRNEILNLLASMDILANAQLFVGTLSSNIGMFLGMRMDPSKFRMVDSEKWSIW